MPKFFGLSPNAALKWIKAFAKANYEKAEAGDTILLELDGMWHYLKSKKTSFGYGKHTAEKLESLLTGNVEAGTRKLSKNR